MNTTLTTKRLTADVFLKMLEAHPDFPLTTGCWMGAGQHACGGCAMTLAFHHAKPSFDLKQLDAYTVESWANDVYGLRYTRDFIAAFDGDINDAAYTDAMRDGRECLRVARSQGRLNPPVTLPGIDAEE
jgi:hypothetical protein